MATHATIEQTSDIESQPSAMARRISASSRRFAQLFGMFVAVMACGILALSEWNNAAARRPQVGSNLNMVSLPPHSPLLSPLSPPLPLPLSPTPLPLPLPFSFPEQHIWIIRHGDKYSSYPDCPENRPLCFNKSLMGDNPPLTSCGVRQAKTTADWLKDNSSSYGGIKNIAVSPFARTLQTSLPLAKALGLKLKVEYLLSEANQPEGPFQPLNTGADKETKKQLEEASDKWDLHYGSPPIATPETPVKMYDTRVKKCAKVLKERFPPLSGNLAIFTHATTSFSIAYGLCYGEGGNDSQLQKFVEHQKAIAPAGVIHVVLDADGKCKTVEQTNNVAETLGCGKTEPFKCEFADFPAWYWSHANGKGPGKCH